MLASSGAPIACQPQPEGAAAASQAVTTVFAAASLRECIEAIGRDFKTAHPNHRLRYNFAGSQTLQAQIEHGAQPQIFVAAACRHTDALHRAKRGGPSRPFASNRLVVVVPKDNPAGMHRFEDLWRAKRLVLPARSVPAGDYAEQVLRNWARVGQAPRMRRVQEAVVSREAHVRLVLQKVALGEADAGMVYATDAPIARGKVRVIPVPNAYTVSANYCFAEIDTNRQTAPNSFAAFLSGKKARMQLRRFGFSPVASEPMKKTRKP